MRHVDGYREEGEDRHAGMPEIEHEDEVSVNGSEDDGGMESEEYVDDGGGGFFR
jgi:hypothetical protein